jgi:hypothetical protein
MSGRGNNNGRGGVEDAEVDAAEATVAKATPPDLHPKDPVEAAISTIRVKRSFEIMSLHMELATRETR